ncbi:MBL fold metallo-hydrolase [Roseospirillum parvum]|uniref:Glyoxylase, beta-lactamase superfamily II n=1 Tax=Roseospirillum parvum TaxID=83401 RepID=A0A1G7UN74_9PROT|nr:MBL fold metallo-hydrolase [Roseospirillum parvum]SDG48798.1 Glyoxylase, beta-lactamase superfamily II [Roseospirillum parvum]
MTSLTESPHLPAPGEELIYPLPEPPSTGELIEVAPGVRWLRLPLPFALDHVNLWLIDEDDGATLVDTGIDRPESRAVWEQVLAGPLRHRPIRRIVCTHFHPDHMGLAGWLGARFGAPLLATAGEWAFARALSLDTGPRYVERQLAFYRRAGLDRDMLGEIGARGNSYAERVGPIPDTYQRLLDGMTLTLGGRPWRVITGRGHAPEHACLYCPDLDVLISGDQVLPRISPNVGVWPQEPDGDPLPLFLASLERLRILPGNVLVLPSHGRPFRGLRARLDTLAEHHRERLRLAEAACPDAGAGVSGAEVIPALFKRAMDTHQTIFAVGESLAHLHLLWHAGRLIRQTDAAGVARFRRL